MKKFLGMVGGVGALMLFLFLLMLLASKPASINYTGQSASVAQAFTTTPTAPAVSATQQFPLVAPKVNAPAAPAPSKPANTPAPTPTAPPIIVANPLIQPPSPVVIPPVSFGYQYEIPKGAGQGGGGGGSTVPPPVVVPPTPTPDTTAPVISASSNITAEATSSLGAYVAYAAPTATDNTDGTDAVSCAPLSNTLFALGTTTVLCSAADAAGNAASTTFAVVAKDTTAPAIAASANVSQVATSSTSVAATVTYTSPTTTDAVSGAGTASCLPASGSLFGVGTTTVQCNATDTAGNTATSTFDVGVYTPPAPAGPIYFTFAASQTDESYLCDNTTSFNAGCYAGGDTQTYDLSTAGLQGGALQSVTIALDHTYAGLLPANAWNVTISCFTDIAYTTACTDWVASSPFWNLTNSFVSERATTTTDGVHWTAYFTNPQHEANFNGTSPVTFNPAYYYRISLYDYEIPIPAYGSLSQGKPYFILTGVTQ